MRTDSAIAKYNSGSDDGHDGPFFAQQFDNHQSDFACRAGVFHDFSQDGTQKKQREKVFDKTYSFGHE